MEYRKTLKVSSKLIDLSTPQVMGIVNLTPDSFYDGGRLKSDGDLLKKVEQHLYQGAAIIDVGGHSTRPGAEAISVDIEISRVVSSIELISRKFPDAIISVDTFRSRVARESIEAGAGIVNDVSGGELDAEMFQTVADLGCPYILMHMRGAPQTMKNETKYEDILREIVDYFVFKVNQLHQIGVNDIIVDPGFGFAKTADQSYYLLRNLSYFNILKLPVLAGISRKSMIYKKLGITSQEALNGTSVLNTIALMAGANILRVHDVKEAVEAIQLYKFTFD